MSADKKMFILSSSGAATHTSSGSDEREVTDSAANSSRELRHCGQNGNRINHSVSVVAQSVTYHDVLV